MRREITGILMLFVGGVISASMLTRLDRESRRLLELDKYWYPRKQRGTDESELRKIKLKIKIMYNTFLVISIVGILLIIVKPW